MGDGLEASSLSVTMGGRALLRSVSMTARAARVTAIVGPNGAGKTTLLKALLGLIPSSGQVALAGVSLAGLDPRKRARTIAYVPQQSLLDAAILVQDVVAHGRFAHQVGLGGASAKDRALVVESLKTAGIEPLAERTFTALSGGEQRLVLIARALCTGARALMLDEPTASLDIERRLQILSLLRRLANSGRVIVCVLHDLNDARRIADDVLLLQDGQVVCAGASQEVIVPDRIREVYGVDMVERDALGFRLLERDAQ